MSEYVRVRKPFATWVNGRPRVLKSGQVVEASDPAVADSPHSFEEMDERDARVQRKLRAANRRDPVIERTTAAPGEEREVSIPQPEPEREPVRESEPVEPEVEVRIDRPADYAPKGAWVDYALEVAASRGEDVTVRELNDKYTKPELISRYG